MTRRELSLKEKDLGVIYAIGCHARGVLRLYMGQCQSRRIALDLLLPVISNKDLLTLLDPWAPSSEERPLLSNSDETFWLDLDPILDLALGGALVALKEKFERPSDLKEATDSKINGEINRGVGTIVELSLKSINASSGKLNKLSAELYLPNNKMPA